MNSHRIITVHATTSTTSTRAGDGQPVLVSAHLLTAENGNRTVTVTQGNRILRFTPDQAARLASAIIREL